MTVARAAFGYFSTVILLSALMGVTRRNPVHSVLWVLLMFLHVAGMYLFLCADFLAAVQIIVYAGAILVLYLFVVMLLDLRRDEPVRALEAHWPLAALVGAVFAALAASAALRGSFAPAHGPYSVEALRAQGLLKALGSELYRGYLLPFEIASLVLLAAIIGAIVLTKRRLGRDPGPEGRS